MKLKLFYSLKRKVLAVCLAGMILMALCVGGISLWTISHLTYDYEIQNMNHLVDTKATIINDELLRSESIVNYATNSVSRKISDPDQLRNPAFQQRLAQSVDHDFQDATTNLHIICSYYLYYPSENISALWKASRGHDSMFYDVLAQQRGESGQAAPRHVVAFAYLMDQGKAAWTQPYYSPYLNRYIISYLRPIYEDGVMVAIIGVDLDFQAFIDRLYAKPSEGEEHGMINPDDIGELSRNFQAMAEKVAAAQENLTYMSQHDALTGILNRMGLDKEVADWLKAHPASHGALVSLDLDGFKFINDLHGHMAGDEALRTLAKDLIESFGHDQIIGRNGGDEFVVFMKDTEPEQAEKVIKAFSNKVKTFTYDGETHAFSVSIGYTLYKGDGTSLSRLFHQSDTALYAVKLRGRNHYRIYDATMENLNRTSLGFNLETITKNLPLGLLVSEAKPHGKILFVNKTMVEMLECRNIHEFMEFTQGYAPNVVCTCDRERMTKMVWEQSAREPDRPHCMSYSIHTAKGLDKRVFAIWRMADNPNYGEVFYATLMEASFLRELTSDDGECKA